MFKIIYVTHDPVNNRCWYRILYRYNQRNYYFPNRVQSYKGTYIKGCKDLESVNTIDECVKIFKNYVDNKIIDRFIKDFEQRKYTNIIVDDLNEILEDYRMYIEFNFNNKDYTIKNIDGNITRCTYNDLEKTVFGLIQCLD